MLKASIPLKTWAQWDDHQPGFLQIDLVGHEGGDNNDAAKTNATYLSKRKMTPPKRAQPDESTTNHTRAS
jgi:hypothetical protein